MLVFCEACSDWPMVWFVGAGCEGGRRLHDDHRRDAALLPDQTGVVLHSVPAHPSACAEEH